MEFLFLSIKGEILEIFSYNTTHLKTSVLYLFYLKILMIVSGVYILLSILNNLAIEDIIIITSDYGSYSS